MSDQELPFNPTVAVWAEIMPLQPTYGWNFVKGFYSPPYLIDELANYLVDESNNLLTNGVLLY